MNPKTPLCPWCGCDGPAFPKQRWIRVGGHCEVQGEGRGAIFSISRIDAIYKRVALTKDGQDHGWESVSKIYRTPACRKLDKGTLS